MMVHTVRSRKLAAIMFTDMIGYTALMQRDEQLAKDLRDRQRSVLDKAVLRHNGKTIQYYGDGTLTIFESCVEAVGCAVEIQQTFRETPKVPVRIGIHSGEVVQDQEGIYGDVVNIASRVESLAVEGSVLVSEKVYDDLKNHPEFKTELLGTFEFKNVKKPLEVYAIKSGLLRVPSKADLKGKTRQSFRSIAVLPFVNMSSDPENEYFSDGITEEILNALTKVRGFQVTSRTSAFAFKNQHIDVREIGERLNVNTVLEGSVRKAGNQMRITAQLISTSDGYHLWSEVYDRKLEDIFELQDEISINIANKLKDRLGGREISESLVKRRTKNIENYNLYLKALFHINKYTPEGMKRAIDLLKEVITLEPEFPQPYTQVSFCYGYLGATGQVKPSLVFPKSMEYAKKAMLLDDTIFESHLSYALGELYYHGNLNKSYIHFQRAFKLNPGASVIYQFYSIYLLSVGNLSEARSSLEKALELDPLSLVIISWYAYMLLTFKQYDDAIEKYDTILEMNPDFRSATEGKAWALLLKGDIEEAMATFKLYQKQTGSPNKGITGLGYTYACLGENQKATEVLDLLFDRQRMEPESSVDADIAIVYAGLKDFKKSIYYLESVLKERKGIAYTLSHPMWEEAKKNEDFRNFLSRLRKSTQFAVFDLN